MAYEIDELKKKIHYLQNKRHNTNESIKDFCNRTLPFLLVADLLNNTIEQLEKENLSLSFNDTKNRLSGNVIKKAMLDHDIDNIDESTYNEIAVTLLNSMYSDRNNFINKEILKLSSVQQNIIISINNKIKNRSLCIKKLLNWFNVLKKISIQIKELNNRLNGSYTTDFVESYLAELKKLDNLINNTENKINLLKHELNSLLDKKNKLELKFTRVKNLYFSFLQNDNNLKLSSKIIDFLDNLIDGITNNKINLIEKNFIDIFNSILRKKNYITDIDISYDFKISLYVDLIYSNEDIINILKNLNAKEIHNRYGTRFVNSLSLNNKKMCTNKLIDYYSNQLTVEKRKIPTKINVNEFSMGEKQIYILSLIWALIKSSSQNIPFILDTPFARIDENHRQSLTNIFIPTISHQVILLTTDKEIDRKLYKLIKPRISQEYLLIYNEDIQKTEVKKGYFEV